MVVPMMKYSFLVLKSEHEKFLDRLSELGVIDVTINDYTPSDLEQQLIGRIKELQLLHSKVQFSKNEYKALVDSAVKFEGNIEYLEQLYLHTTDEIEQSKLEMDVLNESLAITAPWGEFSVESIERLKQYGISLRYFNCSTKAFTEQLKSEYPVEEINQTGGSIYFILIVREGEEHITEIQNCKEMLEPRTPLSKIQAELKEHAVAHESLCKKIASLVAAEDILNQELERLKETLQYNKIKNSNQKVAEESLIMVEGWTPQEKCVELDSVFETMDTTLVFKEKPKIEDEPPVLLKNGAFARSAEVITKLYSLPKYNEVDMTPFLAPFFMLFVGMCIGDCGYGALMLVVALIAKMKVKKEDMQGIINLILYCSVAIIGVGFITGVFFGENLAEMKMFESIKGIFIPTSDMFGVALAVGVVQIIYSILLRSIIRMRRYGILYGFASFGWLIMIVATICAMMLPKIGITSFTTSSIAYYIAMGVAGVMMFFFQDPKKNPLTNFGMGLWAFYNNVTGLLGDVLSYIRLFALGLSGGVIAGVFNELAVSMSGDIPVLKYVIMILILLVGHGINLFMSAIGSIVHPLRLTFVEFYNNVGFEGGGREYNPFKKRENN